MDDRNTIPLFRCNGVPLIGKSPKIIRVMTLIEKFAPADSNVLILGPSGTGKELVANSIHHHSDRSRGSFIAVNCAVLPETLIESELFGHARGTFTGATTDRRGHFEAAMGGTIFLDEIGEMPPAAQAKLLRALQEKKIRRLGENHDRPIDCRVVAATNRDLETACRDGKFREDLYYRLAVAIIHLPPLSEHIEDIPLLVDYFLGKFTSRKNGGGLSAPRISEEAMDAIMRYSFPGNVRELEHSIESAILLSDGKLICFEDLPENMRKRVKKDFASQNPNRLPAPRLLEALTVCFSRVAGLPENVRPKSIRTVKMEDVARYLAQTGGREFSRKEFELFLRERRGHDMNKSAYATAGRCLVAMVEKGIIKHNGGKANKSRFRVSEDYLMES